MASVRELFGLVERLLSRVDKVAKPALLRFHNTLATLVGVTSPIKACIPFHSVYRKNAQVLHSK